MHVRGEEIGVTNDPKGAPSRFSRSITIGSIVAIVAVIAVVLFTSERDGPGSAQLEVTAAPVRAIATTNATAAADASARLEATQATAGGAVVPTTGAVIEECVASETMPGGNNFYVPNAPQVESLGTGLIVSGTVGEAGTCKPIKNARIFFFFYTASCVLFKWSNRGSVMTDENGHYRLETSPVVPQFGQPHVHIAYDDGAYHSLFLRAVMPSKDVPTFTVDFVLGPRDDD